MLYLTKIGNGSLILARNGNAKVVGFSKTASGALFDNDIFFLANESFLNSVNLETLGELSKKADFEEVVSGLQKEPGDIKGVAFTARLSIQEPIETLEPLLIADLDKTDEEGQPIVKIKKSLSLPKLNINLAFLSGKGEILKIYGEKIKILIMSWSKKAYSYLAEPWRPREPGVLEEDTVRKKKRTIQIAGLLAALLIVSIGVGSFNRARQLGTEKQEKIVAEIKSKLADAENLKIVNPTEAANLVSQADKKLSELSSKNKEAPALQEKVEKLLAEINRIFNVSLEEVADLGALKGGIDTSKIKLTGNSIIILDIGTSSVYKVDLKDKKSSILVSEEQDLQNIAPTESIVYLQTKKGIKKVDINYKTKKELVQASSKWKRLVDAATYREYFYILDKDAKQIWKYVPDSSGLTGPQSYFTGSEDKEFLNLAIDGAIWVSTKDAVYKYLTGKKADFEIKHAPQSFEDIAAIYTKEGLSYLYILDKSEGAVFVIEKANSEYAGLYRNSNLKNAESLVVDEANKTVYILSENIIYSFKLK